MLLMKIMMVMMVMMMMMLLMIIDCHLHWHVSSLISEVEEERLIRGMVIYHFHCLPGHFFK